MGKFTAALNAHEGSAAAWSFRGYCNGIIQAYSSTCCSFGSITRQRVRVSKSSERMECVMHEPAIKRNGPLTSPVTMQTRH